MSPECKFGPDRDRRLDTGGAAQSATPYGRLKFSPRSRPNYLRKVTSEGRCSMGVAPIGASEGGGDALLSFESPSNGVAARVAASFAQHDRGEMEVLFALLAERYEQRSVAITSNLVFSNWCQIFQDPLTTHRVRNRIQGPRVVARRHPGRHAPPSDARPSRRYASLWWLLPLLVGTPVLPQDR